MPMVDVEQRIAALLIASTAIAMVAGGCGGGSSSDANEPEASKTFLIQGGSANSKKIVRFGEEADKEEREAASEVLEENMAAREAHDLDTQCSSLSEGAVKRAEKEAAIWEPGPGCKPNLRELGTPWSITKEVRENTMTGPIDALRVKGDRAWALYHGAKGKDYAVRMEKEDGEWKVDTLTTTELR
jgi:hypothetical protein